MHFKFKVNFFFGLINVHCLDFICIPCCIIALFLVVFCCCSSTFPFCVLLFIGVHLCVLLMLVVFY